MAAPVPVELVVHDFLRGRAQYELAHGKGMYPGYHHNKAATAIGNRALKAGVRALSRAKRGKAYWQQYAGLGRKGLGDAAQTGADCAHLYGADGRDDPWETHEVDHPGGTSVKRHWCGNTVTEEGEEWVPALRREALAAKRALKKAAAQASKAAPGAGRGGSAAAAAAAVGVKRQREE
jgi:hypothetical protein